VPGPPCAGRQRSLQLPRRGGTEKHDGDDRQLEQRDDGAVLAEASQRALTAVVAAGDRAEDEQRKAERQEVLEFILDMREQRLPGAGDAGRGRAGGHLDATEQDHDGRAGAGEDGSDEPRGDRTMPRSIRGGTGATTAMVAASPGRGSSATRPR
jgi:hypothetical protein